MADSIWGHAGKQENILDFKAGQLYRRGNMIHSDPRKGRVVVFHDMNRILHIKWMTRPGGESKPEEDLLIMKGDCVFESIEIPDGKVFVLKFLSGKERFFWIQEPTRDRDEQILKKIEKYVKNPEASEVQKNQEELIKGYQKQKEKREKEKETAPPTGIDKNVFDETLASIFGSGFGETEKESVSFNEILDSRRVQKVLIDNPDICKELVTFLPKGTADTPEGIMEQIRSAQFRDQCGLLDAALKTGQVEGLTLGFNVPPNTRQAEKICRELAKKYDNQMKDE